MNKDIKIYFAGSIRGAEADRKNYLRIIKELKKRYIVLTEHVGNEKMLHKEKKLTDKEIESRDMRWLKEADFVVAEITSPSHGVGIELNESKHQKKPILCIHKNNDKKISAMISGCDDFFVASYTNIDDAISHVESFVKKNQ
ncbi:MAG: hypothetical protein UT05_C0001G0070 [Parcubacteria group bacterium GW2011_GWF2_38_76]|nr:MAG: hypothetical protein UT05_C0001G0070 [Parcubacteria group bacterium GW2011_GWF2_38_76]HBM45953.1 nucleoside 2-deoxyribosyltransferase [Patescibacteria group bacterium]